MKYIWFYLRFVFIFLACILVLTKSASYSAFYYTQFPLYSSIGSTAVTGRYLLDDEGLHVSWTGGKIATNFKGRFIGLEIRGPSAYFEVTVDTTTSVLKTINGFGRYVLASGLEDSWHSVSIKKRSETHGQSTTFLAWFAENKATIFKKPVHKERKIIQVFADSWGAGYGNSSASQNCSSEERNQFTDPGLAYPSLVANYFDMELSSQSYSGIGAARNYGGRFPDLSLLTLSDVVLFDKPELKLSLSDSRVEIVVIEVGLNDYSTPLGEDEAWDNIEQLNLAWRSNIVELVKKVWGWFGDELLVVFFAPVVIDSPVQDNLVIVKARLEEIGIPLEVVNMPPGLDLRGCHNHPSLPDHVMLADRLIQTILKIDLQPEQ